MVEKPSVNKVLKAKKTQKDFRKELLEAAINVQAEEMVAQARETAKCGSKQNNAVSEAEYRQQVRDALAVKAKKPSFKKMLIKTYQDTLDEAMQWKAGERAKEACKQEKQGAKVAENLYKYWQSKTYTNYQLAQQLIKDYKLELQRRRERDKRIAKFYKDISLPSPLQNTLGK